MTKKNLESVAAEIDEFLKEEDFVVFRGYSRPGDSPTPVYWDDEAYPDFRPYLGVARQLGVKLVNFHRRVFVTATVEDALDRLEASEMPPEESRPLQRRLKEFRAYDGFTGLLELSFDYQGRSYIMVIRTEWYSEFLDILEEIDAAFLDDEEDDGEEPMGGYFSTN